MIGKSGRGLLRRASAPSLAAAFAALVVTATPVLANGDPNRLGDFAGHGHMWGAGGGWGMIMGPIMMILFFGILVAIVVLIVRWLSPHNAAPVGQSAPAGRRPLEILEERFARGEIDREEFEERRRVLSS